MYRLVIADDEFLVRKGLTQRIDWAALGFEICGQFEDGRYVIEYVQDNPVDAKYQETFTFEPQVKSITWMDNDQEVFYEHKEGKLTVYTEPFQYGRSLVVRVAKIVCE